MPTPPKPTKATKVAKGSPPAKRPKRDPSLVKHRSLDWNDKRLLTALYLIFEGRLAQAKVAQTVTIPARTLKRWIIHPDFKTRLAEMRADLEAAVRDVTYANKQRRIVALSLMAESARAEYEERPWLKEVRPTRDGDITNDRFNEGAFGAFRGALDDVAKELGQRKGDAVAGATLNLSGNVVLYMPQPETAPEDEPRRIVAADTVIPEQAPLEE